MAGLPLAVANYSGGTDVVPSLAAEPTFAVSQQVFGLDSHTLAHREIGRPVAQSHDLAREFMAPLMRVDRTGGPVGVKVTAADTCRPDPYQDLALSRNRRGKSSSLMSVPP